MRLVWKLLRQHISIPQFVGFLFANLFGMFIVLLSYQFYLDVMPVFTAEDSFMSSDFIILNKKIGTATTLSGNGNTFSQTEQDDLNSQPFVKSLGAFTSNEYKVNAEMVISGAAILNSEIFLESVPDSFIDTKAENWTYKEGDQVVPILLPRSYLTMYNFGFAQSHSLPKISDGLVSMIDIKLYAQGNGRHEQFKGKVIGFSNRLNSILVPQRFMEWSNQRYAPDEKSDPNRLIMKVDNPADEQIAKYVEEHGYEIDSDRLNAEKTTYFLRLIITMVMIVGLIISLLSFYILMLSIYLLVEKNTQKLQNLLLIGYTPSSVAHPYQLLAAGLNAAVLLVAWGLLLMVRHYYLDILETLSPDLDPGIMNGALLLGLILFALVVIIDFIVIRRRILRIWNNK